MIRFENIKKSFGNKHVLKDVSFEIAKNEVFFIIGTSGVGKSVLIKQIVGLIKPEKGLIFVDEQEVTSFSEAQFYKIRKKCALVLQNSTLFDALTCEENVALPLLKHGKCSRAEALKQARSYLKRVDMLEYAQRGPAELGDGMKKRIAVARALAMKPAAILFDEPTTGLDPQRARRIDQLILRLAREEGVTCVVVSHDLKSILEIADRVAFLYQGRVHALGSPNELLATEDPIVLQFLHGQVDGPLETT